MSSLRNRLKLLPFFGRLVERVYRRLTGRQDIAFTIADRRRLLRRGVMVKIGANDGWAGDSLAQLLIRYPEMQCIFVEPVLELLERARKIWGQSERFAYVNAVINESGDDADFYYVDPAAKAKLPPLGINQDQVGSLSFDHVAKHLGVEDPQNYISKISVAGLTINELLNKYVTHEIDVLHIDAEGWDWKILSKLDLAHWRPIFIVFEKLHLTSNETEEVLRFLGPLYKVQDFGADYLCERRV